MWVSLKGHGHQRLRCRHKHRSRRWLWPRTRAVSQGCLYVGTVCTRAKALRALMLLKGFSPAREIIRRVQSDAAVMDLAPSAIQTLASRSAVVAPPCRPKPNTPPARPAAKRRLGGFLGSLGFVCPQSPIFVGSDPPGQRRSTERNNRIAGVQHSPAGGASAMHWAPFMMCGLKRKDCGQLVRANSTAARRVCGRSIWDMTRGLERRRSL